MVYCIYWNQIKATYLGSVLDIFIIPISLYLSSWSPVNQFYMFTWQ